MPGSATRFSGVETMDDGAPERHRSKDDRAASPCNARVLVFGTGGVGTMAAYALQKGGRADVTAVLRSNYEVVHTDGFTIRSVDHGDIDGWRPHAIQNTVPEANNGSPFDFIVVATKAILEAQQSLVEAIRPAVDPVHTSIVLLQNGLNVEKTFRTAFPSTVLISGVSMIGATESPKGTIRHSVHDELVVGPFDGADLPKEVVEQASQRFVDLYNACPTVNCLYDADVQSCRWRKLLYNASFNSTAAITGLDVTRMRVSEHVIDDLVRPIMQEISAVAAVEGVVFEQKLIEQLILVDPYEAFFLPSMGQDVVNGNLLEYESILGEPLRIAERRKVAVPTLRVVYSLLRALQWRTRESLGQFSVPKIPASDMKYG